MHRKSRFPTLFAVITALWSIDLCAQGTVSCDKPQHVVGESLIASFSGSTSPTDWFSIHAAGGADIVYSDWQYTNGTRSIGTTIIPSGQVTFSTLNLGPGNYELRFFANNGYTLIDQAIFSVMSGTVSCDKSLYSVGESLVASFAGSNSAMDWLGLYNSSGSHVGALDWRYTNGKQSAGAKVISGGQVIFSPMNLGPGVYELRFFSSDAPFNKLISKAHFTVTGAGGGVLACDKSQYLVGEGLVAAFSGSTSSTDWITIHDSGSADAAYLDWRYTNGTQVLGVVTLSTGQVSFSSMALSPGNYDLRFFKQGGHTLIAQTSFRVVAEGTATIASSKTQYVVGEHVVATFSGVTSLSERLGIYTADGTERVYSQIGSGLGPGYQDWRYPNGRQDHGSVVIPSGQVIFLPINLPVGDYHLRLFSDDPPFYTLLNQSPFTVVDGSSPLALAPAGDLTVMTFNILRDATYGPGGLPAVVDIIAEADADIIGLQETSPATNVQLVNLLRLKPGYASVEQRGIGGQGVISRYPITKVYAAGRAANGVRIRLPDGSDIRYFSCHLIYLKYGPYAAREGASVAQLISNDHHYRNGEFQLILDQLINPNSMDACLPTFIVGDFNVPSKLDWTPANADQNFGLSVNWPVSQNAEDKGFRDLYRDVHPDPVTNRGYTWSPGIGGVLNGFEAEWGKDVHDRIDMLYFRPGCAGGDDYRAVEAYTYCPDPFPSDHRSVVASLDLVDRQGSVPLADLSLTATGATGGTLTALPELLICSAGDTLQLNLDTPNGSLQSAGPVLAFQLFPTSGSLPGWPGFPSSFLDPSAPLFSILLISSNFPIGGYNLSLVVPPGVGGVTCRMQGYAAHAAASNGVFDTSNALDFVLR